MLYKVVLTFESVEEILKHPNESYWAVLSCGAVYYATWGRSNISVCGSNPKAKATEQYFPVEMGIMLYKVVLTFKSTEKILKDSSESYWVVLSCGSVCYAAWGRSNISVCGSNPKVKATKQYFSVAMHIMLYKVVLTFESVDEILKYDQSNESYWAVLSCGAVYYAVQSGSNFWVCGRNLKGFKWKLLSSTFLWKWVLCCTRWFWLLSLWEKS